MRFRPTPIICLSAVWLLALGVIAQESRPSEYQIKAAFIFNFAKFVEWPPKAFADKTSPFVIGVLGENPFGDDLEKTIHGKTVNDRPFEVKLCKSPAEARQCHILFISSSEKKKLPEIIGALGKATVLTIGEMDQFTEQGGIINFVLVENKVRFQINNETARGAGLTISSKLLSLALHPGQ